MTNGTGEDDECTCVQCRSLTEDMVRQAMAWAKGHRVKPSIRNGREVYFRTASDVRDGLKAAEKALERIRG